MKLGTSNSFHGYHMYDAKSFMPILSTTRKAEVDVDEPFSPFPEQEGCSTASLRSTAIRILTA